MLLAVDIGNTNIVCAVFDGDIIVHEWRVATDSKRTGDEYTSILLTLFRDAGVTVSSFDSAILSSVVPDLIGPFVTVLTHVCGKKPKVISPAIYDRLPVQVPESAVHEIGTDLLCNAVEAWTRCHGANIVVDFGTALTFTVTDSKGNIQGVAIAPGLGTAVHSLFANTAQLPAVPLEAPPSSLGTNTIHSIQAGIVLGYKGLVESLIARIKDDLCAKTGDRPENVHVIATGGLNSVLKPITDVFAEVDKELTLCGLKTVAKILK